MAKVVSRRENNEKVFHIIEKENPAYAGLVDAFKKMILSDSVNDNCRISIDIGKRNKKIFQTFLHSSFMKPIVNVDFVCNDEPMLKISSFDRKSGGSVMFNLTMTDNISIGTRNYSDGSVLYIIEFHYAPADMDYLMELVIV